MVFYYNSLSRLKQCLCAHICTVTYTDPYIYTYISIKEPDLIGTTHTVLFPTTQNVRGQVSEPLWFSQSQEQTCILNLTDVYYPPEQYIILLFSTLPSLASLFLEVMYAGVNKYT